MVHSTATSDPGEAAERVRIDGKHLSLGGDRFVARGVTYGSFTRRDDGHRFPDLGRVDADFALIAGLGLNTVRVYDVPPTDVLDAAEAHDLRVLVGLDYHDWRFEPRPGRAAQRRVAAAAHHALDEALARCAGRPEVLALSIGNEVPADIVRVHGVGAVSDVLGEVVAAAHAADHDLLVTYTSFPTTEFLEIEGLDLTCFNVFLERPDQLRRYLRHLQIVSGDRPLLVTELGLAAELHGDRAQADTLEWQLRTVDEVGCAGAMVFAFTDEWAVAGQAVEGWGFGITTADRTPKPAARTVSDWAARDLKDLRSDWPRVSVVVCAYNEERTIGECLASLERCDYPDLEVIVCNDGSTDRTREIAATFPFAVLDLPHGGLSAARNAGIAAATGDIVAFLDADATCHPQWPWHLVLGLDDDASGVGGPNLPVPGSGLVERAVALSPGSAQAVLVTDDRAEHVPGCNMAFRRGALLSVGGFDPVYTSAGDDVDVCWKVLDSEGDLAYAPAAQVRHHRRASVRGYLRQQRGYGRSERLLLPAHRHRFNRFGQASWTGVIYGGARLLPWVLRPVVYHGHQGRAPFQPIASRPAQTASHWAGALVPLGAPLAVLGALLAFVSPWFLAMPAAVMALTAAYGLATAAAVRVERDEPAPGRLRLLVGALHVLQPYARAWGRLRAPRRPDVAAASRPWWGDRTAWLQDLERVLRAQRMYVRVGGPYDAWDLEVSRWPLTRVRVTTAVAWRWEPQWRLRLGVRWAWLAAAATAALTAAAVWQPIAGVAATAAALVLTAVDATILRRRVVGGLVATSRHDVETS